MSQHYDLLEHCKRGDAKAQRMLYDIFSSKLMGLCRRYTKCREEAQDVLQESFIKIFTNIRQLEAPDKLEAWMKTTAIHTAINYYHKTKKNESLISSHPGNEMPEAEDATIEMKSFSDEHLIVLINDLPDGCRIIFNLYAVEGYSHLEIADLLQITQGTSRSQYHYAKSILKTKLKSHSLSNYYAKFA